MWIDIEQNTEEWKALRLGKITCSEFDTLFMAESTKGFKRFINEKAYERAMGKEMPGKWQGNADTERGHEMEIEGIKAYEFETFSKVTPGGFWVYSDYIGGSPDGHVGEDGLIEVKSRDTQVWLELVLPKFKPSRKEFWQCMGQMLVSGRKWVDLVYTPPEPEFKPLIYRIDRDEDKIAELIAKLEYANRLIDEKAKQIESWKL